MFGEMILKRDDCLFGVFYLCEMGKCFYYRSLLRDIHDLKTASGPAGWHEQEAKELSAIVQRRLHYLQVSLEPFPTYTLNDSVMVEIIS